MRKLVRVAGVREGTIRRIIKDNFKAKSMARARLHLITDSIKTSRLQRLKRLLNILKI